MNNFYDWEGILAMKGLREAVVSYAMSDAPGCLEDGSGGVKILSDDECPYLLGRAIREKGECAFYFSRGADDQIQDHAHYRFAGKYFECDGAGQIGGPYDDNNADIILDLLSDAYAAGFVASPDPGATVSVSRPNTGSGRSLRGSAPKNNRKPRIKARYRSSGLTP